MLRTSRRFGGPIGQLAMAVNQGDARAALATLHAARAAQGAAAEVALAQGVPVQQAVALALQGRAGMASYAAYAQALARWPEVQRLAGQPAFAAAHAAWVADVLAAFDRFRLLCAVREGDWGVAGLNRALERALDAGGHIRRSGEWYAGRPVMVSRNDAALGVFNGDIGMALPGAAPGHALRVFFPQGGQVRSVGVTRLAQVETAFAMTVHKSQGSEFEHTALVLSAAAGGVLGRELVYTGITRARQAFTLLAERPGLLEQAIASPTRRASGLPRFLDG
jgi:exodeoxyribonuclease V alpha subunit